MSTYSIDANGRYYRKIIDLRIAMAYKNGLYYHIIYNVWTNNDEIGIKRRFIQEKKLSLGAQQNNHGECVHFWLHCIENVKRMFIWTYIKFDFVYVYPVS